MQRFIRGLVSLTLAAAVAACGGGSGGEATPNPGLLAGDPASPALAALTNKAPEPAASADIVDRLILTRLDMAIAAGATVGQVNAALGVVGGTIVAMRAGLPAVTVAVPRQPGPDAMRALANTLQAQPGIRAVLLGRAAGLDLAPPSPANADAAIGHLQTAKFPAAWNARTAAGACSDKVTVIVADAFHRPIVLDNGFAAQVPGVTDLGQGSADFVSQSGFHGYEVLTTLAAKLDATVPTGANPFPECLDINAVQLEGHTDLSRIAAIDEALLGTSGKVVLNTSYSFGDACVDPATGDEATCTPQTLHAARAVDRAVVGAWQRRQLFLDADSVLVTSTAGNNADDTVAAAYPGAGEAEYNSAMNVAATADSAMSFVTDGTLWQPICPPVPTPCLLPDLGATPEEVGLLAGLLVDLQQTFAPPATNVIIVGSSDSVLNNPSEFSEAGADVQAVGQGVPTLAIGAGQETTQGTSFAAPQVAGLASYLWMLSPDLRALPVAATIDAIKANASTFPAGMIDAYATVLSLDRPEAVTPQTARVRLAILDIDGDGDFDLLDLQAFHAAYVDSGAVLEPGVQDFSRFDLNGDGFTGGSRATRMDLDPTGSTRFGAPVIGEVFTEVGGVDVTFDEREITDAQALCFYANSALYSGADLAARDALLSDLCPTVTLGVEFPSQLSTPQPLIVSVLAPTANGGAPAPAPNLLVELSPTCASVSAAGGFTDANGQFTATVTPDSGCTSLSVTVTVRQDASLPPLARQTVAASTGAGACGRTVAGDVVHGSNGLAVPTQDQLDALADVTAITGNLRLGNNQSSLAIRLPCLKSIGGHLQIIGHFPVIEIAALETVGRFFRIGYFNSLPGEPQLDFPVLRRVGGELGAPGIDIAGAVWLSRVNMAALEFVGGGIADDPTSPLVVIRSDAGLTVSIGPGVPPSRIQINAP